MIVTLRTDDKRIKKGECLSCPFEYPFDENGIIRCGFKNMAAIPWDGKEEKITDKEFCPIIKVEQEEGGA